MNVVDKFFPIDGASDFDAVRIQNRKLPDDHAPVSYGHRPSARQVMLGEPE